MNTYKYEDIDGYLQLFHPRLIRQYLWIWIIMMDFIGIPVSLYGALNEITILLILPLIIVMNIWAVFLLNNTEEKQHQYILFIGVYSLSMSIILLLASYKIIKLVVQDLTLPVIFTIIFFYGLINISNFMNVQRLLRKGHYSLQKKSRGFNKGTGIIVAMSGLGVLLGRILVGVVNEQFGLVILSLCLLLLSFVLEMGSHNIYKYYLLKKIKT